MKYKLEGVGGPAWRLACLSNSSCLEREGEMSCKGVGLMKDNELQLEDVETPHTQGPLICLHYD